MVLESYAKVTATAMSCIDFMFMLVLNTLAVPMSLAYTALAQKLSDPWTLTPIPGIHYIWWSVSDNVIKGSGNIRLEYLGDSPIRYPRLLLTLFILSSPVLIISEIVCILANREHKPESQGYRSTQGRQYSKKGRKRR